MEAKKSLNSYKSLVRSGILKNVNLHTLGNSGRDDRDLAIDLINASNESYEDLAEKCFLHPSTVKNLAQEKTLYPQYDTLKRVLTYFGVAATHTLINVKSEYQNRPKD